MFPISTTMGGQCLAFPDACFVPGAGPPIIVPFPNVSQLVQAVKGSEKVLVDQKEVLTLESEIPNSVGDNAGVQGGVVSHKNMGATVYRKGSAKVFAEGHAVVYFTATTSQNDGNAMGVQLGPSMPPKVFVAP